MASGRVGRSENRYPYYIEKLTVILDAFRDKLDLHDVPFLSGGLGDYLPEYKKDPDLINYIHVNDALMSLANERKMTGFVSAKGLTSNSNHLHFNAKSLREFGVRYYNEFLKLEDKNKVFFEKSTPDDAIRTGLENL